MRYFEPDDFEYKEPIWFHIPAIFDIKMLFPFQASIYNLILVESNLRKNVRFSVYGCPCSCTWNGGRYITYPTYKIEVIKDMFFNFIYNLNMNIQITFTNTLLEKTDVYDRLGNAILRVAEEFKENCEILIASDILEDYVRKNYPLLKIARSTVKLTKPSDEDFERYSTIVVPKWNNKNMNYLKSIKDKDKIELLVDELCITNCPRKRTHYEAYNKSQLFIEHDEKEFCDKQDNICYNELMILPKEINTYIDLGIHHFKLSGREDMFRMMHTIMEYAIKSDKRYFYEHGFIQNLIDRGVTL